MRYLSFLILIFLFSCEQEPPFSPAQYQKQVENGKDAYYFRQARDMMEICTFGDTITVDNDEEGFYYWQLQEVEGFRQDLRIINTALIETDWYVQEVKRGVEMHQNFPDFMIDSILNCDLIIDKTAEVESLSKGERTLSLLEIPNEDSTVYTLKVGEDNGMNFVTYYTFEASKYPFMQLRFYDPFEDRLIDFGHWLETEKLKQAGQK